MKDKARKANDIILNAAVVLAVAGFANPFPLAGDVIAIVSGWSVMLARIAYVYEVKFSKAHFSLILTQAWLSIGAYGLGTMLFLEACEFTGVGTVPAKVTNAILNAAFTIAVGNLYRNMWAEGQKPTSEDIKTTLKDTLSDTLSGDTLKNLIKIYQEAKKDGLSNEAALKKLIEYLRGESPGFE